MIAASRESSSPEAASAVPQSRKEGGAKQAFKKARDEIAEVASQVAHGTKRLLSQASSKKPETAEQRLAERKSSTWSRWSKLRVPTTSEPTDDKAPLKVPTTSEPTDDEVPLKVPTTSEPTDDKAPIAQNLASPPDSSSSPSQPTRQTSTVPTSSSSTGQPSSPESPAPSSPIAYRSPRKLQKNLLIPMEDSQATRLPLWAQSPSAFEAAMFYYGLGGVALQARTVDPERKQPLPTLAPKHPTHQYIPEDLLAAWPREGSDDFNRLDRKTIKMNIVRNSLDDYMHSQTDHWTLYRGLDQYAQRYMPLTGPGQHPTLPQIWHKSLQSKQGLVPDLVSDVSDVPAQVMLLPIRIQMGARWSDKPVKTVLLVDMRQKDWLPQKESLELAYRCKATLKRHNIHDVEVEVRAVPSASWETQASPSQSDNTVSVNQPLHTTDTLRRLKQSRLKYIRTYITPKPHPLPERVHQQVKDALNRPEFPLILRDVGTLGLEISTPKASAGTMGLILRLQGNEEHPERIVGLTCHHAVQRPDSNSAIWPPVLKSYLKPAAGVESSQDYGQGFSRDVLISHPDILFRLRRAFGKAEDTMKLSLQKLDRTVLRVSETDPDRADQLLSDLKDQKMALAALEAIHRDIPQDCPTLGDVFASGAFGAIIEIPDSPTSPPTRFLSDWALVNIEPRFYTATPTELSEAPWLRWLNRLHARSGRLLTIDWKEDHGADPQYWANTRINDPHNDELQFLKISGIASQAQLNDSTKVAKDGATTGFTIGNTIGVPAVIPRQNATLKELSEDKDKYIWSTQLIVVGEDPEAPFSKRGDSGSAVINEDGQVVGMLVSGLIPAEPTEGDGTEEDRTVKDQRMLRKRFNELLNEVPPESVINWLASRLRDHQQCDLTFIAPIEAVLQDIYDITGQQAEIA